MAAERDQRVGQERQPQGIAADFLRKSGLVDYFQDITARQNQEHRYYGNYNEGALISSRNIHELSEHFPRELDLDSHVHFEGRENHAYLYVKYNGSEDVNQSGYAATHFDRISVIVGQDSIHVVKSNIVEKYFVDSVARRDQKNHIEESTVVEDRSFSRTIPADELAAHVRDMMVNPVLPERVPAIK